MTPQQQRIVIAEACGWSFIREGQSIERNYHIGCVTWVAISTDGRKYEYRKGYEEIEYLTKEDACNDRTPDYLNDLNAMHEAEKVLIDKGVNAWWAYVAFINRHNPTPFKSETAVNATASQRAKAFLQTLELWQETSTQPQ